MCANAEVWVKTDASSESPTATLKKEYVRRGLGDLGCGHHHPDAPPVMES